MTQPQAEQLMGKVQVETFGAASGHYPDGPQYVHYINRADVVPDLAGLGPFAPFDPTKDAGKGAVIDYFTENKGSVVGNHSITNTYMPHRVPFAQARQGDFSTATS